MNRTGKKNGEKGKTRREWNNTEKKKREVEEKKEK